MSSTHDHSRHGAKQPERFDPAKAAKLDDPARFEYLPPAYITEALAAPQGACVIDFGTGTGTYAIELAQTARGGGQRRSRTAEARLEARRVGSTDQASEPR